MLILSCDTTGPSVSVALWQDEALLSETTLNIGLIHSATFMPLVQKVLDQAGQKASEITHFAVTTGPGSFTGIRIGISAVKAMAYANNAPVVGATTLDVLAWPYRLCERKLVCPLMDARNGRAYSAAWLRDERLIPEGNRLVSSFFDEAAKLVLERRDMETILYLGMQPENNDIKAISDLIAVRPAPVFSWLPRASVLAEMAMEAIRLGKTVKPAEIKATYLTLPAAERLRQNGTRN